LPLPLVVQTLDAYVVVILPISSFWLAPPPEPPQL
jgi:hypothetical protein